MRTRIPLALAALLAMITQTPGADAPGSTDTSFLKLYAETRGFMLGRPTKPKVSPDGKSVLFLRSGPKTAKNSLFEFDVATGKTRELLSPETLLKGADENLTPEEKARRERQRVSVGGFADYHLNPAGTHILVKLANSLFVFDRAANKATELKTGKDGAIVDPKWSPDGKLIGYVRGFDVYAYDLAAEKESAITTSGTQIKTHGLAEFVAQEEMGRHSGFWWSPDSKSIAYEEADHTGVEQWFVADPLKPDVPPAPQYYPRPGKKNVSVRLGVKKLAGGDTVWVEWDREKWGYLNWVTWQKYGTMVIQVQNRDQIAFSVRRVDAVTGKTDALEEAYSSSFLNIFPESLFFLKAQDEYVFLQEGDQFPVGVPASNFSLYRQRALLAPGKKPLDGIESLSRDPIASWRLPNFSEVLGCNVDSGEIAYARVMGSWSQRVGDGSLDPTCNEVVLHSTSNQAGRPAALPACSRPGRYSAVFSSDLLLNVMTSTSVTSMPISVLSDKASASLGTLPSVALEPDFKPDVTVSKVGEYWTAIVRPKNIDPKKKYPVIVDVYGGPKHLHVVQAMRNWLVPQWLADQGFIVVAIDNRGTPGRGAEWEKAIYKKFGTVPLEDQVKGLHALCDKFPELDRDRVGIVGWSFGGYMAANGVLRRPDVFKAAVAGAPVTDWEDYDTHYTERYMGLLPESKAAYDEASLIPLAKNLKRPLLLVHGTADDNVYYRHSLKLADALFRAGRDFESLALPGITHMYSADPVIMERLWSRTAGYFQKHLGEPK